MKFLKIVESKKPSYIEVFLKDENDTPISKCKISFTSEIWQITEWYTNKEYQHKGYGTDTLKFALKRLFADKGEPREIHYVWNGENAFVFEWLKKHFSPTCLLAMEVRKYLNGDDWRAHIYVLDKGSVMRYMVS